MNVYTTRKVYLHITALIQQAPTVILVAPQLGENIGAAARVMSNFALNDLRIVAPRDGWPNPKAIDMAAGGAFIIEQAKIYQDISQAIADLTLVLATSAQVRHMNKPIITSGEIPHFLSEYSTNNKVGILFGRERSGLTNEELVMADAIVRIPVTDLNPSLNLAQAVAIICYELTKDSVVITSIPKLPQSLANKQELEYFFSYLEELLTEAGFLRHDKLRPTMQHNIRNMLLRTCLTSQDVRTLHGIIRAISQNTKKAV